MVLGDGPTFRFDPDIVLAALGQAITVLHPGDALAVLCPPDLDPVTLDDMNERTTVLLEETSIKVLFVSGDEFAVIRAGGGDGQG